MHTHYAPQDHIPLEDTPAQAYAREFHTAHKNIMLLPPHEHAGFFNELYLIDLASILKTQADVDNIRKLNKILNKA